MDDFLNELMQPALQPPATRMPSPPKRKAASDPHLALKKTKPTVKKRTPDEIMIKNAVKQAVEKKKAKEEAKQKAKEEGKQKEAGKQEKKPDSDSGIGDVEEVIGNTINFHIFVHVC